MSGRRVALSAVKGTWMSDSWTGGAAAAPPPGGGGPFPPPGTPPAYPAPGQGSTPPGPSGPPQPYRPLPSPDGRGTPYLSGAAHKPGAVPLRPLGLSDLYDAAFRIIRFNPTATVGAAVVVASISMALPLLVTAIFTGTSNLAIDAGGDGPLGGADVVAVLGSAGSFVIGTLLSWLGTLLVTGLIVHVTMAAALGRRLSLGEAWAATHGTRLKLVLMALTVLVAYVVPLLVYLGLWVAVVLAGGTAAIVVWGVVTVPAFGCFMAWWWIRVVYLGVPALVVERAGVFAALRRSFVLSRRQFWRTFGIALLTLILTAIASQVLTTPISLVFGVVLTGLGPEYTVLGLVVTQALTVVIAAAFVTPFTAAVTSLQYLDQRMRKEAFDVELMQRAGVTAA